MNNIPFLLLSLAIYFTFNLNAQVAINSDGSSPDGSAMLEVKSTDMGFLPPRMTTAQRDAIGSPAEGLMIYNTDDGNIQFWDGTWWYDLSGGNDYLQYPAGMVFCASGPTAIVDVTTNTGKTWMDRNLGASQQATSSTDALAYGDLYQWGRFADGHQCRTSPLYSSGLANIAAPNAGNAWDGKFITNGSDPYDWLTPQNDTLWQGVGGTNNPCPAGYRLPTEAELESERQSWSPNTAAGAYASPLKLSVGGYRHYNYGSLNNVGIYGLYWSNTVNGIYSRPLILRNTFNEIYNNCRADGFAVRCIKD
jgi:hypothetical protein